MGILRDERGQSPWTRRVAVIDPPAEATLFPPGTKCAVHDCKDLATRPVTAAQKLVRSPQLPCCNRLDHYHLLRGTTARG